MEPSSWEQRLFYGIGIVSVPYAQRERIHLQEHLSLYQGGTNAQVDQIAEYWRGAGAGGMQPSANGSATDSAADH
jgi:hypothetical protein